MRHLKLDPVTLSEAEIEAAWNAIHDECPVPLYDNLTDEQMAELANEDRR